MKSNQTTLNTPVKQSTVSKMHTKTAPHDTANTVTGNEAPQKHSNDKNQLDNLSDHDNKVNTSIDTNDSTIKTNDNQSASENSAAHSESDAILNEDGTVTLTSNSDENTPQNDSNLPDDKTVKYAETHATAKLSDFGNQLFNLAEANVDNLYKNAFNLSSNDGIGFKLISLDKNAQQQNNDRSSDSHESNFFQKAATSITGFFINAQPPKVTIVSKLGGGGEVVGFAAPRELMPIISHEAIISSAFGVVGHKITFSDYTSSNSHNHLYFVSSPALTTVNTSGMNTVNLSDLPTGIIDYEYIMRAPLNSNLFTLSAGSSSSPGSLSADAKNLQKVNAPAILNIGDNIQYPIVETNSANPTITTAIIAQVPQFILSQTRLPTQVVNPKVVYNFGGTTAPDGGYFNTAKVADYSGFDSIQSFDWGANIGTATGYNMILNTTIGLAVLIYNYIPQKGLIWVDQTNHIFGRTLFAIQNPGSVIETGDYNVLHVNYANGDRSSDILFGSDHLDGAYLIYGSTAFSPLFSLANIPSTISYTHFVTPSSNLVGTPIANDVVPLDSGAALNALSTTTAGVNFVGDVNGDGIVDILVQKHSTNYAYDSDLAYIIYGQNNNLPTTVNLYSYTDPLMTNGNIGIGLNASGQTVQDVHGFTISGPIDATTHDVIPLSFSIKSAADVNADGFSDLFALANNDTGYLIFGGPNTHGLTQLHIGSNSTHEVIKLFALPDIASSIHVPTINDINYGYINGDPFGDFIFSKAINVTDLNDQTVSLDNYLTNFTNQSGESLGSILSGKFLADTYFQTLGMGSAYSYLNSDNTYNTSHITIANANQTTIEGFTGIDNLIGSTGNQIFIEHSAGATNPNLPGIIGSTMIGGDGNNIFVVQDPAFQLVKGGTGFDILRLNSGTLDFSAMPDPNSPDLSSQALHNILGIEKIELGDNTNLVLDAASIFQNTSGAGSVLFTGTDSTFTLSRLGHMMISEETGASNAHLSLKAEVGFTWLVQNEDSQNVSDGKTYTQYDYVATSGPANSTNGHLTVFVATEVPVAVISS